MVVFGFFLWLIGLLLCFTVIGAIIGIPLILIGAGMMVFGFFGRRKTVIQNVVTVQNAIPSAQERPAQPAPANRADDEIGQSHSPPIPPVAVQSPPAQE